MKNKITLLLLIFAGTFFLLVFPTKALAGTCPAGYSCSGTGQSCFCPANYTDSGCPQWRANQVCCANEDWITDPNYTPCNCAEGTYCSPPCPSSYPNCHSGTCAKWVFLGTCSWGCCGLAPPSAPTNTPTPILRV